MKVTTTVFLENYDDSAEEIDCLRPLNSGSGSW